MENKIFIDKRGDKFYVQKDGSLLIIPDYEGQEYEDYMSRRAVDLTKEKED